MLAVLFAAAVLLTSTAARADDVYDYEDERVGRMFVLTAVLTVLQTSKYSTFKVLSPFETEQLCHDRAPELVKYVVGLLPSRNLIAEDVKIETECLRWN